jgi:glycerol-3-phosphate dehydrogenase
LVEKNPESGELIHSSFPYIKAEIIWAVQNEMCMTVEDLLARRTRALFLDAKAAMESAPFVAALMAKEMGKDESWIKNQVDNFYLTAKNYLPISN